RHRRRLHGFHHRFRLAACERGRRNLERPRGVGRRPHLEEHLTVGACRLLAIVARIARLRVAYPRAMRRTSAQSGDLAAAPRICACATRKLQSGLRFADYSNPDGTFSFSLVSFMPEASAMVSMRAAKSFCRYSSGFGLSVAAPKWLCSISRAAAV